MYLPEGKQVFNFNKDGQLAYPDLKMDLLGNYQRKNAAGVLKTIELLQEKGWTIGNKAIYLGFSNASKNTGLRGRWEVVDNNPLVICDTAHNAAGLTYVAAQIEATPWKTLYLVLGMVNDKDLDQALAILPKEATYLFTQAKIPRALPAADLAAQAAAFGLHGQAIPSVPEAVAKARSLAQPEDLIFIGGSTFVVADYFS